MLLRRKVQRIACAANTLAYVLVFGVVIIHVLHRRDAANVGPGDDQDVVFWFEAGECVSSTVPSCSNSPGWVLTDTTHSCAHKLH